jgi:hypothetical protein
MWPRAGSDKTPVVKVSFVTQSGRFGLRRRLLQISRSGWRSQRRACDDLHGLVGDCSPAARPPSGFFAAAVEVWAEEHTGSVLKCPDIHSQCLLRIGAGNRHALAVAEVEAKRIKVAIEESVFTLVDQVERFGLIRFQGGNCFREHGFGFIGGAKLLCRCGRREDGSSCDQCDGACGVDACQKCYVFPP